MIPMKPPTTKMTYIARGLSLFLLTLPCLVHAAEPIDPGMAANLFQVLFGLLVVLSVLGGIVWLLKRFPSVTRTFATNTIKIVSGVSVGPRERILIIEIADQWIVVGVAPGRINTLATLPRGETHATADATALKTPNLAAWIKQAVNRRNGGN